MWKQSNGATFYHLHVRPLAPHGCFPLPTRYDESTTTDIAYWFATHPSKSLTRTTWSVQLTIDQVNMHISKKIKWTCYFEKWINCSSYTVKLIAFSNLAFHSIDFWISPVGSVVFSLERLFCYFLQESGTLLNSLNACRRELVRFETWVPSHFYQRDELPMSYPLHQYFTWYPTYVNVLGVGSSSFARWKPAWSIGISGKAFNGSF